MNITQTRVKQYNSTYKTVISVDGVPVCITQGNKKASDIVSYLSGYEVEIYDGKLKRQLDKIKSKIGGKQMRLIDADKLYTDLANGLTCIMGDGTNGRDIVTYVMIGDIIRKIIDEQSVYDPDKVMERHEGIVTACSRRRGLSGCGGFERAIEFVKGGGVDKMTIDEQIAFCEEKSKNIKLKAEPQTFVDIVESLKRLREYEQNDGVVLLKDIYNKAVDDTVEAVKEAYEFVIIEEEIDEIGEKLKAGDNP